MRRRRDELAPTRTAIRLAVGQQADAQRHVLMLLEQIRTRSLQREANVDVRIRLQEFRKDRDEVDAAEADRGGDVQLAARRAIFA